MIRPADLPRRVVLCMRVADMPVPALDGDQIGKCVTCALPVRFRPYMAELGEKLCTHCAGLQLGAPS